jgi:hypothetical protein
MLAARFGYDPLSHFPLEHQGQRRPPGRPGALKPAQQQRGADIVGKVGDNMRSVSRFGALVDLQRIPGNDPQPFRIFRFSSAHAGRQRRSRSTDDLAPVSNSARVRPPGPGPTS